MSIAQRPSNQENRTGGYGELAVEIRRLGLLDRRPWFYTRYYILALASLAGVIAAMVVFKDSWFLLLLAPVLAVVSTQLAFFGHDVGHLQVTRNKKLSRFLGVVDGNLIGGLSYRWWVTKHNAHHAHPNDLESDPDVAPGALVFDAEQASKRTGFAGWVTRHQAGLFFPFLFLEALNLHFVSVQEVLRPGRRLSAESLLLLAHFVAYTTLLVTTLTWAQALVFFAVHKGLQGLYLGCSFAPNHKGMPMLTGEQAQDPLLRQVLTSRNIRGGVFTDWALGGLNYQIEHHLFPSMPRPNLRHAQPVVQQFCADRGVSYTETSAVGSYVAALRYMHEVGAGLRSS